MSMRTKLPRGRGLVEHRLEVLAAEVVRECRPSAVSLTLTFESSRSRSISAKTPRYACAIVRASSSREISSPSTSIVASFPSAFRPFTARTASGSVAPAM